MTQKLQMRMGLTILCQVMVLGYTQQIMVIHPKYDLRSPYYIVLKWDDQTFKF